jgi:hypothetical protein
MRAPRSLARVTPVLFNFHRHEGTPGPSHLGTGDSNYLNERLIANSLTDSGFVKEKPSSVQESSNRSRSVRGAHFD